MEEKLSARYIDSREGILLHLAVGFAKNAEKPRFDQVEKSTDFAWSSLCASTFDSASSAGQIHRILYFGSFLKFPRQKKDF